MRISELKKKVQAAYKAQCDMSISLSNSDNPQIIELYERAVAQREVLDSVLQAINNDPICLDIYAY